MAGEITQNLEAFGAGRKLYVLTFTCTADAADGSYPATAISTTYMNLIKGWELSKIQTIPGSTAPKDLSDMTLKDSNAIDILGGAGTNKILNAATKEFFPEVDGNLASQEINDTLTLAITGNDVNSAIVYIKLFINQK